MNAIENCYMKYMDLSLKETIRRYCYNELTKIKDDFGVARFCLEVKRTIPVCSKMQELEFSASYSNIVGKVLTYNPDKWECSK